MAIAGAGADILVKTTGLTVTVSAVTFRGNAASLFSDAALTSAVTLPVTISADTHYYAAEPGSYDVTVTHKGLTLGTAHVNAAWGAPGVVDFTQQLSAQNVDLAASSAVVWRGPFLIDAAKIATLQTGADQHWHLAITGTPAGGTFTLVAFDDVSHASNAIAFNADAAAVQAAIESIGNIGAGAVSVTGTNPAFDVVLNGDLVSFLGNKARVPMTVGTNSLTGGTAPAVALTETQPGRTLVIGTQLFTPAPGDLVTGMVVDALTPWNGSTPHVSVGTLGGSFAGAGNAFLAWRPNESTDLRPVYTTSQPFGYVVATDEPIVAIVSTGGVGAAGAGATTGTANLYVQTATPIA